jgi:hypothetical protein
LLFNIYYMIIDKKIEVKIDRRNIEHYSLFYKSIKLKDIIEINTELHLQKGSNIKINVSCDICNIERYIKYQAYTKNINSCKDYTIYTCDKCSHIKLKNYNIKKYGVEYYSQHPDRNDKVKKTCLNKYGVEHFSKSELFNEKVHKTNLEKFGFINPFMDTERIKGIFKEKYGVEHPAQFEKFNNKIKETNLERYGYKSVLSSPIIREKIEKTNIIKYGYTSPMKNYLVLDNFFNTCMFKYGSKTYMGTDDFNEKSKKTILNKYGVVNIMKSNEIRKDFIISLDINYIKYLDDSISLFSCEKGHTFKIHIDNYHGRVKYNIPLCSYPIGDQKSIKEKELLKFIKSVYSGEIVSSYRDSLEIDIYLPELKLGFEFNGLYWHSNKFKEKNYHLNKTDWFKEKGIRIIHIWEDDWILRREIVESQIKNSIGLNTNRIFARKCYIKEVDVKIARKFLNENHIQGFVNSSNKLGLYYNEDLVSIMTFDNNEGRKKMELFGYNLNRFCNKKGINVIGGASKLLSHFIKSFDATRIVSYADKDWSIGDLYYKLGFINVGGNGPDYKYIVDNKRVHKSRYKKSKLNTTLTESKQMEKDGFLKIYDCGKLKFELKIIKKSYN